MIPIYFTYVLRWTHGGVSSLNPLQDLRSSIVIVCSSSSKSLQDLGKVFGIISYVFLISLKDPFVYDSCVACPTHWLMSNHALMCQNLYYIQTHVFHMHLPLGLKHFPTTSYALHDKMLLFIHNGILKGN